MFNIVKNRDLLVARLRREASYLVSDLVPSRGMRVQPFVVVCTLRVGSNMLRYALETHPQVVHYGEIFRDTIDRIPGAHGKYAYRPRALIQWRRRDARSFLDDVIFRDTSPPIRAVGFKLFYWHGRDAGPGNPWPVLRERDDVRVIHLVRGNPVAAFVSAERAAKSTYVAMRGRGERDTGGARIPTARQLVVDVPRFREYLLEYNGYVERMRDEFRDHEVLELTYEELADTTEAALARVLVFLGAEPRPLHVQTQKQSSGRVVDTIVNRAEVASAHAGTRWAHVPAAW